LTRHQNTIVTGQTLSSTLARAGRETVVFEKDVADYGAMGKEIELRRSI